MTKDEILALDIVKKFIGEDGGFIPSEETVKAFFVIKDAFNNHIYDVYRAVHRTQPQSNTVWEPDWESNLLKGTYLDYDGCENNECAITFGDLGSSDLARDLKEREEKARLERIERDRLESERQKKLAAERRIAATAAAEERDKREYERLKKKFEGKMWKHE